MPGYEEHVSVAAQAEAGNRLQLWLKKISTVQKAGRIGKVPVVTNTTTIEVEV